MKSIITSLLFMLCVANTHAFTLFGESEITEYWSQSNDKNDQVVDHSIWDEILGRYVRENQGINLFSYGKVSSKRLRCCYPTTLDI